VLTDAPGVEALARAGINHARPAVLYGIAPAWLVESAPAERDIDMLFVGNLHPAVQRERLPWLARLARLADRWNVVMRTGTTTVECQALLSRARIAFNRSVRGEANMRAFEAPAAGALLFQEMSNREVPDFFTDRRDCVYYDDGKLKALLEWYMVHDDERRVIAEAARAEVAAYTFPALLMRAPQPLWEDDRARLEDQARRRRAARVGQPFEADDVRLESLTYCARECVWSERRMSSSGTRETAQKHRADVAGNPGYLEKRSAGFIAPRSKKMRPVLAGSGRFLPFRIIEGARFLAALGS
jgi:hypothetical protein